MGFVLNPEILEKELPDVVYEAMNNAVQRPPVPESSTLKTVYVVHMVQLSKGELSLEEAKKLICLMNNSFGIKKTVKRYGEEFFAFSDINDAKIFWNKMNSLGCVLGKDIIEFSLDKSLAEEMKEEQ